MQYRARRERKWTLILMNYRFLLSSFQKCLLTPESELVDRLGEAQNTHSDFIDDILHWALRSMSSGGVINTERQKKSWPSTYRCMKKPGQNTGAHFERIHCPCPHQIPSQQILQLLARALRSPCTMKVQRTFLFSFLEMHGEPDSHKLRILQV